MRARLKTYGFLFALGVAPSAIASPPNASLARAEGLLQEFKYADAGKALEAALQVDGNDRATLLRILELQGIVDATLHQAARAARSFRILLALDPRHTLPSDQPPRVMTPFYEAKGWVEDHGVLAFKDAGPNPSSQWVEVLKVEATSDSLGLAHGVRFHVRAHGTEWAETVVPLSGAGASLQMKEPSVAWWAELLDERHAVLAQVGSAQAPLEARGAAVASPSLSGVRQAHPERDVPLQAERTEVKSTTAQARYRPLAYTSLGLGVAAIAVGSYMGVRSSSERAQLNNATRDSAGRVIGLDQHTAFALDSATRSDAVLANVLFGAGAGLAVLGAGTWWWGGRVAVAPAPGGVVVTGSLP